MNDSQEAERSVDAPVDRRSMLGRIALGGGAVVAGAVGGVAASASGVGAGGWKRQTVEFDVACVGDTWREGAVDFAVNDSDARGRPFLVEGWLYPPATIPSPGDGFVPTPDGSIGRWLCRGNVLLHADRPEPHVVTAQEFVFAPMAGDRLFPEDLITTSGIEGTFATQQVAHRSVIGGTGRYLGASGQQDQSWNGFNTSVDGYGDNAPNFVMRFDLLLPDV